MPEGAGVVNFDDPEVRRIMRNKPYEDAAGIAEGIAFAMGALQRSGRDPSHEYTQGMKDAAEDIARRIREMKT